jgi:SAM-dependent methyltransferase
MNDPYIHNRRIWDQRARERAAHTETAQRGDLADPLAAADPLGWIERPVSGKRILCLAAGGGKHGPLFAKAGAIVTVVDLSSEMLALDRKLANELRVQLRAIEASMDNLPMLPDASFDAVVQPVSTCYMPDVRNVYSEVARILVPGGVYISQHKQPAALQAAAAPTGRGYLITEPYKCEGPLPIVHGDFPHRESGALEFLHTWEELIGGMCRSGFVIEDLVEPRHSDRRAQYLPPFVAIKARKQPVQNFVHVD